LHRVHDAAVRARRNGQAQERFVDEFSGRHAERGVGYTARGDRVIKSLALFLKQRLRKTDYIGRYGGEEFAVVLPDTDAVTAAKVLDEIRRRFAEIHYPAQPQDLSCTFSCGIAELAEGMDCNTLSKQADEALYVAKRGGRNRVEIHRVALHRDEA